VSRALRSMEPQERLRISPRNDALQTPISGLPEIGTHTHRLRRSRTSGAPLRHSPRRRAWTPLCTASGIRHLNL